MELKKVYNQVLGESVNMALATAVGDRPNVRVVTFGYDSARENRLYFSTFQGNRKIEEFAKNPQVACIPLPAGPEADSQVRIFGRVQKSALSLEELIGLIGKKAPGDAGTLMEGGDMLEIYEIRVEEAWVTVGMTEARRYEPGA